MFNEFTRPAYDITSKHVRLKYTYCSKLLSTYIASGYKQTTEPEGLKFIKG